MPDRRSTVSRWADHRRSETETWGSDPTVYEPESVERLLTHANRLFGPRRWFDTVTTGWENVPDRPVLVVANHSGGTSVPDMWGLLSSWYAHFGTTRPLYALGHELIFGTDATARFFAKRGVLRASRETADRVLAEGGDLLVTPGGERDVWRPWTRRWNVEFAGRTGYARLALRTGSPILPVAGAGAHHTFIVLADGHRFARAVGLTRVARAEIWPLHLSVPWGLALGPWPHLPVPHRLRFRIGKPVEPNGDWTQPDDVAKHDQAVRAALQAELDAIRADWRSTRRGVRQTVRDVFRARQD